MAASNTTLSKISYLESKKEEVIDRLTTPRGSRVYLKNYGSRLFDFIDSPLSERHKIVAEVGKTLIEMDDFVIRSVDVTQSIDGKAAIRIDGYVPSLSKNLRVDFNG